MSNGTEPLGLRDAFEPVRWFLDIDGTISPYGLTEPWPGPTLYRAPTDSDFAVPFRREVVDAIQRLHSTGLVEVVWLTTWDAEATRDWAGVGLGPFPIARRMDGEGRRWKGDAVSAWMVAHPHRQVVWTDDDITEDDLRGLDLSRLLAIAPAPACGLSVEHLAKVERWAIRVSGR